MNEQFDLNFCFKGDREYIHGTDIFIKLLKYYQRIDKIDIAFHGISINNLTFYTEKPDIKDIKVSFRAISNENKIKIFGIENNSKVKCTNEYKEERIVKESTINIDKKCITLSRVAEYSFIEHIVAMNKALVENIYPNKEGKWYFTRLQINNDIDISIIKSINLNLLSNFQFKLTKSSIIINNENIGFIYFSLINKV